MKRAKEERPEMKKIGFIGTGSLGSMLIRGFVRNGVIGPENINVINRSPEKPLRLKEEGFSLRIYSNYRELINDSEIIFICVKPNDLPQVLERTGRVFPQTKLVVSTLLAPSLSDLEQIIDGKLIRIYPSVTQSTGRGVTIVTWGQAIGNQDRTVFLPYLNALGKYYVLPENLYRAAGDITSCGPAFMAAMVGALAEEGIKHGISPEIAGEMAVETMLGTALLLLERKLTFSELISQVATPGGCTAEGLKILEKSLPGIMDEIYEATCNRQEAVSESVRKALSH
ncbi:hypothetical protein BR63_17695 [Thermanaerosceptrum fracticalcis]|uniref:Pyrroline-5-carboxylate reductase n=2 Tax=Thermanaerosceptrum fracticalcis TaxID=1712410 RepID=A0A7G6E775_THEFR|nr:hypothetical protein BR63_17695 [Thermanaerosceptrum fracticalcis]